MAGLSVSRTAVIFAPTYDTAKQGKCMHYISCTYELTSRSSVDAGGMEQELKNLRAITAEYRMRDIYNLDQTALFWKRTPERSLATISAPGLKVQKGKVTIAVSWNADGSDKVRKNWYQKTKAN